MENKKLNLEEIHKAEEKILDYIVDICDKNNLKYYLFYGSLIGAIRHKGFIPWDDDIDLVMPIADYDKFIEISRKETHPYFKVVESKHTKNIVFNGIKVVDTRYKVKEWEIKENSVYGLFVDIFPLVNHQPGVVNEKRIQKLSKFRWASSQKKFTRSTRGQTFIKLLGFLTFRLVNPYYFVKKIDREIDKSKTITKSDFYRDILGIKQKLIFPKKWFSGELFWEFENKKYRIPKNYDNILKQIYGNYMEIPPVGKRATHYLDVWEK